MSRTIWTIGHSTHPLSAFVGLLKGHGIAAVADVRMYPGSRRHPHFSRENLSRSMPKAGIDYAWLGKELGGRRRRPERPSRNVALRVEAFRNFADYMETDEFAQGIDILLSLAKEKPTAYFCAELLWWRCHRSLISDYLVAVRGWEVHHILDESGPKPHKPKAEARVEGERLVYAEAELFPSVQPPSRR